MRNDRSEGPSFSDEEAREILRRAAELDARSSNTSLADLTQSASDAGIHPDFVIRAAAEVIAAREGRLEPAAPPRPHARWTWIPAGLTARLAFGGALGTITGILERFVPNESLVDVPSFIVLVAAAIAFWARDRATQRSPIQGLIAALVGYGAGWAAINLDITPDLVMGLAAAGVISAAVAALRERVSRVLGTEP